MSGLGEDDELAAEKQAREELAFLQATLSRVERTSGQLRALNSALIGELNRACNDLAAARAEMAAVRSAVGGACDHGPVARVCFRCALDRQTDSPPNSGAGPREEHR